MDVLTTRIKVLVAEIGTIQLEYVNQLAVPSIQYLDTDVQDSVHFVTVCYSDNVCMFDFITLNKVLSTNDVLFLNYFRIQNILLAL